MERREGIKSFTLSFGREHQNLEKCFESMDSEQRLARDHILLRGKLIRKSFWSLSAIPGFNAQLKKNLKDNFDVEVGNSLQLHAAANILGGRNCFLIGSLNSLAGKSLSYLIPIITKLSSDREGYSRLQGDGPLVLIVCATVTSGLKLDESLHYLTTDSDVTFEFIQDKETYDADKEHERRRVGLLSGRKNKSKDIILATAEGAAALVEDSDMPFSFDRLSFLVFDDAHLLLKFRKQEVKTILKGFKTYVEKLQARKCLHQTIFCGSQWTEDLEYFYDNVVNIPVLIISSAIQAIRYCGLEIRVLETNEDTRFAVFKDILSKHADVQRILVVVKDWEDVLDLKNKCKQDDGLEIHFLEGEGLVGAFMQAARRSWNSSQRTVICTSDVNFRELNVKNADLLIHYDIPEDNLRTFAIRYSCMWMNVRNDHQEGSAVISKPLSYVLLDTDLPEANVIIWKLHFLGASIPKTLLEGAEKDKLSRMKKIALCQGFICMGTCLQLDATECAYRHYFVENDFRQEPILPRTGQVELYVTETIAPNYYRAKVLRYCDRDPVTQSVTKFIDFTQEAVRRHERLKETVGTDFISNGPSTLAPGTKVVITLRDKQEFRYMYTRGIIVKVVTRTYAGLPKSVLVNCMDLGETKTIRVDEIFALPSEMEDLPALSVEVVLANTAPPLGEKNFRPAHISKARDYFKLDPVLQADICLSVGNTIWVRRLVKLKKIDVGRVVETWDATLELSRKRVLARNPGHLEKLYEGCEKNGLSCEIYRHLNVTWFQDSEFKQEFSQLTDEPFQWAFIPISDGSSSEIRSETVAAKFIARNNDIFVSLVKFEENLEVLEIELHEEILALKEKHDWNKEYTFYRYYEPGLVVAAWDSQDEWYRRAVITQVEQRDGKDDVIHEFRVFLVDVGEELVVPLASLFPIPKQFVTRLPFQAIKLRLEHVQVSGQSSLGDLYQQTIDFLMPDLKPVDVEVVAVQKFRVDGDILSISHYESFLFGATEEIGEFYVKKNVGEIVPGGEERMKTVKRDLLELFNKRISGGIQESSDAEEEEGGEEFDVNSVGMSDEWDVNFDCLDEALTQMFPARASIAKEVVKDSIESPSLSKALVPRQEAVKPSTSVSQEPVTPAVMTELKKADVTWCQNDVLILIRVLIPDVTEYECEIIARTDLHFKSVKPPGYGFALKLFKRVEPSVKVRTFGQYCEIKLWKRMQGLRWSVLTGTAGLRWIKPELNFQDEDDDEDKKKKGEGGKLLEYQEVDYDALLDDRYDSDEDVYEFDNEDDECLM